MKIGLAGEFVTCLSSHEIATLKKDIDTGTIASPKDFIWNIPEPQSGAPIQPCPLCGEPYIELGPNGGLAIHFADGWRPNNTRA